ncbi:hypothetical protein IMZ48_34160 [Candidatus Bathyarchaeota archaeon]|nr:hypothetical protein [Candidatus Bathyarchaeota archaeon]
MLYETSNAPPSPVKGESQAQLQITFTQILPEGQRPLPELRSPETPVGQPGLAEEERGTPDGQTTAQGPLPVAAQVNQEPCFVLMDAPTPT